MANPVEPAPPLLAPRHRPIAKGYRVEAREEVIQALPIGYLHIDISEIHTGEGKAYLFVAVNRTFKFVHAQLYR